MIQFEQITVIKGVLRGSDVTLVQLYNVFQKLPVTKFAARTAFPTDDLLKYPVDNGFYCLDHSLGTVWEAFNGSCFVSTSNVHYWVYVSIGQKRY